MAHSVTEFEYVGMSPELRDFLNIRPRPSLAYPETEDGRITSSTPTPESRAERDAWEAERDALKAGLPPGEPGGYYRARKAWVCRDENIVPGSSPRVFTCGRYRLELTTHANGGWDYTKGRVYRDGELLDEVHRNIYDFPFAWVENHPNGHDYLIAGENYQGQTVLELDTGRRKEHLPDDAAQGFGFCWAAYTVSPSKTTLAVSGCYWACPYEVAFVDFTDPMVRLPVLQRIDTADSVLTWHPDKPDTCDVGLQYEYCTVFAKPTNEMTNDELVEADRQEETGVSGVYVDRHHVQTWTRGSALELAENCVAYIVKYWPNGGVHKDILDDAKVLISRCPDSLDQTRLRNQIRI